MKSFTLRLLVAVLALTIGVGASRLYRKLNSRPECFCAIPPPLLEHKVPCGWYKVDGAQFFSFYLPTDIQLSSTERSEEATWGSIFTSKRIRLEAEYTSFLESLGEEYLARQIDYRTELVLLDGRKAKIQSWCWAKPDTDFKCQSELRVFDSSANRVHLVVTMKDQQDREEALQIFRTVQLRKDQQAK